jgi:DNA (cytosine-5)-methyltransferase 1
MKIISLFSGVGGLDLGFEQAGFEIVWANDNDPAVWETYVRNHPSTYFDKRSVREIDAEEIPPAEGIIGGPPCQSWSEAGKGLGIEDERGRLFFEYIAIIAAKQPLFFLAENVSGMLSKRHSEAVSNILSRLEHAGRIGYNVQYKLLNAADFGVPQDRKRVFFIGYRKDLKIAFDFDQFAAENRVIPKKVLKDAIFDLKHNAVPAGPFNKHNADCAIPNHEYMNGGFSSIYMSRNRVRGWEEQSYTIQAGGRHAPIHPSAPKMIRVGKDKMRFSEGNEHLYRRLTVRECARIQTFPDDFVFHYTNVSDGYKMVGNAVPVRLGFLLAKAILGNFKKLYGPKTLF